MKKALLALTLYSVPLIVAGATEPVINFSANPTTISAGQASLLTLNATNVGYNCYMNGIPGQWDGATANSVPVVTATSGSGFAGVTPGSDKYYVNFTSNNRDYGSGEVAGTIKVHPPRTTTYTMVCQNGANDDTAIASRSVTVSVSGSGTAASPVIQSVKKGHDTITLTGTGFKTSTSNVVRVTSAAQDIKGISYDGKTITFPTPKLDIGHQYVSILDEFAQPISNVFPFYVSESGVVETSPTLPSNSFPSAADTNTSSQSNEELIKQLQTLLQSLIQQLIILLQQQAAAAIISGGR